MKLKSINFREDETPSRISVSITLEEAIWIGLVSGKQRGISPHESIHSCLNHVFNMFYEGGIEEAQGENAVTIPPIVYPDEKEKKK